MTVAFDIFLLWYHWLVCPLPTTSRQQALVFVLMWRDTLLAHLNAAEWLLEPRLDFLSRTPVSWHVYTDCISQFVFSVCPLSLSREILNFLCCFGQYFFFTGTLLSWAWCPQPAAAEAQVPFEIAHRYTLTHKHTHSLSSSPLRDQAWLSH